MTCGHCGAAVPEDADRCPKCLRRSRIVESEKPAAPAPATSRGRLLRTGATIVVGLLLFTVLFLVILGVAVRHLFAL